MDLLDETRTLIHTGKLLRQPETNFDITGGGWTELFVLLFDNYRKSRSISIRVVLILHLVVMAKPREKDGITKYHVNRRVGLKPRYSPSILLMYNVIAHTS